MTQGQVWDICGDGLGDLWCGLNYYTRRGELLGVRQQVSAFLSATGKFDHAPRMQEIMSVLRLPELFSPQVVHAPADTSSHLDAWGCRYYPTRLHWTGISNIIAVQMDGRSSAAAKNPPPEDLHRLSRWAERRGLLLAYLGNKHTLKQCVDQLSRARAFVGVCSGMSHVAHSVGTPVHLVEYQHKVEWWHRGHSYVTHQGVSGFLAHANNWGAYAS